MTTLEDILKKYFCCSVPFRKDGQLTTTGVDCYKKLEDLLNDLESIGVIYDAAESVRKLDAIVDEGLDEPILANIKKMVAAHSDMDILLRHEIHLKQSDDIEYAARYVGTIDYGYLSGSDVVLLTAPWTDDGDFMGNIYYACELTPESLKLLYTEVKATVEELS